MFLTHLRQPAPLPFDRWPFLRWSSAAPAVAAFRVSGRPPLRKPVILTTNRPFKEWNEVFPNATCIVTLLDRLLHHAEVTVVEGDSYRVRESEQETAARRRKK